MSVSAGKYYGLGSLCSLVGGCSRGCRSGFSLSLLDVLWLLSPCSIHFLYYTLARSRRLLSGLLLLYSTLDIVGIHSNGPKRFLNCPTWMIHCTFPKKNTTVSIVVDECNLSKNTSNRYVNSSCLASLTFPVQIWVRSSSSSCTLTASF